MTNLIMLTSLSAVLLAADMKVQRDVAYGDSKGVRQSLDIYSPAGSQGRPVIVWIHGGGWRTGDKANVQQKPRAFIDRDFVFVSVNYRFVPQVQVSEMAGDIAKAIRWVHDHAHEFGGSKDAIFVAGHSAGAHLAALVCTDERYLKAAGISLAQIKGCIPVDTAAYDIVRQVEQAGALRSGTYTAVFGDDATKQKDFSPLTHVANERGIPAFLLLHVASRRDSTAQTRAFADALRAAGVEATVIPAEGKTHATINRDLGRPDDKPTEAVFQFLDAALKRAG